jgi:hypothetical protein
MEGTKPPVLTKQDFYRRFMAGEFGNRGPQWDTLEQWAEADYQGRIAIRTRVQGGRCDYYILPEDVRQTVDDFLAAGYEPAQLHFSAMCPDHRTKFQGYLCEYASGDVAGMELIGSTVKNKPMREVIAYHSRKYSGLAALEVLRWACDPGSYDHIRYLLDAYPLHVVEFSSFEIPWGVERNNTVIWEVRSY